MAKEYDDLTVVIKLNLYTGAFESLRQDYDVYVKQNSKVLCYTDIKPSKLATVLETVIFNPAVEVKTLPA